MKIISKLKFAAEDEENVKNEVDLMHRVRGHPNVVRQVQYSEACRCDLQFIFRPCWRGVHLNTLGRPV